MQALPSANALIVRPDATDVRVEYAANSDPFGIGEILRILHRRIGLMVVIFAAVFSMGAAYVLLQPPRYQATSLLQISPNSPPQTAQTPAIPTSDYVQSQVELLRSQAAIDRLAARLRAARPRGVHVSDSLPRDLQQALTISQQGDSYVIQVTATAINPELASAYANGLVHSYFELRQEAADNRARSMRAQIARNLQTMQNDVQQHDIAVINYRRAHGLQYLPEESDLAPEIGAMRANLGQAQGEFADLQTRATEGASGRLSGGQNEVLAQLRAREAEVAQREADLSQRYGGEHPTLQAARAELSSIRQQIASENSRQSASLGVEARAASARVSAIQSSLATIAGQNSANAAETAQLRQLQREATVSRNVFEDQLRRYNELGVAGAPEAGDVQLVAMASDTPNQAPRNRLSSLALITALAAVLAALVAYLTEHFDRRLAFSEDVPRRLGLPLLATIPQLSKKDLLKLSPQNALPVGYLAENPHSRFAEAMRVLWVNLSHGPRGQQPRVITVTSATSGEGKTSTALCLARTVASSRQRVILVDCDLRRRSLNYCLGIEPKCGVIDVLSGRCDLTQAIGHDPLSGADILPATPADRDDADMFSTGAMRDMLRQLSERYDVVILDTAPVLSFAEGRTLAALSDGALIVARSGKSNSMASRAAATQLESVGAKILGVVFNAVSGNPTARHSYTDSLYFDYATKDAYNR